jgi:hypothetical protein
MNGDVEPGRPMDYELAPARISRRSSRAILAAAATIVGLLAIAVAIGVLEGGGGSSAPARQAAVPSHGPASSPAGASLRPGSVRCHDLPTDPCQRVAAAALEAIGPVDAPVESIDVWGSLLCGDDLDCPPGRLARLRPLGSAVLTLGGTAPAGWVNVGERLPAGRLGQTDVVAWVIR